MLPKDQEHSRIQGWKDSLLPAVWDPGWANPDGWAAEGSHSCFSVGWMHTTGVRMAGQRLSIVSSLLSLPPWLTEVVSFPSSFWLPCNIIRDSSPPKCLVWGSSFKASLFLCSWSLAETFIHYTVIDFFLRQAWDYRYLSSQFDTVFVIEPRTLCMLGKYSFNQATSPAPGFPLFLLPSLAQSCIFSTFLLYSYAGYEHAPPPTQNRSEVHLLWFLEGYCFTPGLVASKFFSQFILDYFSSTLHLPNILMEVMFSRTGSLAF